ncbi:VPS50 protein, partial [Polypterus senegalus]
MLTDQLEDLKETFTNRIEMAENLAAIAEEKAVNVSSECKKLGEKLGDRLAILEDGSRRLMQVGEEFCGSKSEVLQESIKRQSVNYFKNYHRIRLEELRMFLENETWELCPVKSNFSITQLHEYKFMGQSRSPSVSPSKQTAAVSTVAMSLFEQYHNGGNPFEMQTDSKDDETEDVLAANGYESDELEKSAYQEYDSDSDVPEELKRDYVDEQTGDMPVKSVSRDTLRSRKKSDYSLNKVNAPILTNTTLNVIRLVGKYMQMMNILKPIAFDVIHCMSQLFDYYLYAVYTFFGRNDTYESSGLGLISSRLRTTLNRIQESLIDVEAGSENTSVHIAPDERKEKVPSPHLSHMVDLAASGSLYGLAERVVATESLVFLAEQFEFLQPHLDTIMPAAKKPFLQQFYSQTVSTASELRKPIYWIVAAKAIDYEQMLLLMAGVKWDIKEIMSQHNVYVDVLLKEFEKFSKRLGDISKQVRIPLPVSNVLWEHCIRLANRTLVEGYANVKKCSNEGRALMQLDFQQFLMKLEKLTDIRPIPDKEFVETYIKAYYLTENDMEQFIKNHRCTLAGCSSNGSTEHPHRVEPVSAVEQGSVDTGIDDRDTDQMRWVSAPVGRHLSELPDPNRISWRGVSFKGIRQFQVQEVEWEKGVNPHHHKCLPRSTA